MNKIIEDQLKSCKTASIPEFNDKTLKLVIKKYEEVSIKEGKYYIISLHSTLLNPNANSMLSSNWNGGSVPNHTHYKCEVTKVLGKMIKITGLAYDFTNKVDLDMMWTGWLPVEQLEILQQL